MVLMVLNSSVHENKGIGSLLKNHQKWLSQSDVGPKTSLLLEGNPGNSGSYGQQTTLHSNKGTLGLIS